MRNRVQLRAAWNRPAYGTPYQQPVECLTSASSFVCPGSLAADTAASVDVITSRLAASTQTWRADLRMTAWRRCRGDMRPRAVSSRSPSELTPPSYYLCRIGAATCIGLFNHFNGWRAEICDVVNLPPAIGLRGYARQYAHRSIGIPVARVGATPIPNFGLGGLIIRPVCRVMEPGGLPLPHLNPTYPSDYVF